MKTTKLFNRFLPALFQNPKPPADETLLAALAGVDDNNPQFVALMDQLGGQFETQVRLALNLNASIELRLRALDRAAAMLDTLQLIEENRAVARERKAMEEEQAKVKA